MILLLKNEIFYGRYFSDDLTSTPSRLFFLG